MISSCALCKDILYGNPARQGLLVSHLIAIYTKWDPFFQFLQKKKKKKKGKNHKWADNSFFKNHMIDEFSN